MYLTRLLLNQRSQTVRRLLRDSHYQHILVMSLFDSIEDSSPRQALGVLHRLEETNNNCQLLVQSKVEPSSTRLPSGCLMPTSDAFTVRSLDPLFEQLQPGKRFRFRLRANPTRKINADPEGSRKTRVPLASDEQRAAWVQRKLAEAGLELLEQDGIPWLFQQPAGVAHGRRRKDAQVTHEGQLFEGVATVRNESLTREHLALGLGPGKAYGFGLLSLAPIWDSQ